MRTALLSPPPTPIPDSPSRGRARVVVFRSPSRQCERGFPSLVGTVVFYINNIHKTSSTFRTPQSPQNTEVQYSSSTVQAQNLSKMLLFSPAAGCVGAFGEHAHLPKPLVLAARVGIRTTTRAKPLILLRGCLYYTRYTPGLGRLSLCRCLHACANTVCELRALPSLPLLFRYEYEERGVRHRRRRRRRRRWRRRRQRRRLR